MRRSMLVGTVISVLVTPCPAVAQNLVHRSSGHTTVSSSSVGPLQAAALEEAVRLADAVGHAAFQQAPRRRDNWIARNPVLFGALVGLGVAVGVSAATLEESGNPDVTKGQYVAVFGLIGAGAGAGVGAAISFLKR